MRHQSDLVPLQPLNEGGHGLHQLHLRRAQVEDELWIDTIDSCVAGRHVRDVESRAHGAQGSVDRGQRAAEDCDDPSRWNMYYVLDNICYMWSYT